MFPKIYISKFFKNYFLIVIELWKELTAKYTDGSFKKSRMPLDLSLWELYISIIIPARYKQIYRNCEIINVFFEFLFTKNHPKRDMHNI